jgi:Tfp pilus assembly protein PilF
MGSLPVGSHPGDETCLADDALPEAHNARAVIAIDGDWDFAKAQRHWERALELRPSYAAAHNLYGQLLCIMLKREDEARRHFDRARELDPFSPWNDLNLVMWWLFQNRPDRSRHTRRSSREAKSW